MKISQNRAFAIVISASLAAWLAACEPEGPMEDTAEDVGRQVEEAAEQAGEAVEQAQDYVTDAVEAAGDETERATDQMGSSSN